METAWVLERSYKFTRAQVSDAILGLMATGNLVMEAPEDVAHAASPTAKAARTSRT